MGKFRFEIVDRAGRRRTGTLNAPDLQTAKAGLRAMLCHIETLVPLDESGEEHPEPVPVSLFERMHKGLVVASILIGLLALGVWAFQSRESEGSIETTAFTVSGRLVASELPEDLGCLIVFPEIPYEQSTTVADNGAFTVVVDVAGMARPTLVSVDATLDELRWPLLHDHSIASTGDVQLGDIILNKPQVDEPEVSTSSVNERTPKDPRGEPPKFRMKDMTRRQYKEMLLRRYR